MGELQVYLWFSSYLLREFIPGLSQGVLSSYIYDNLKNSKDLNERYKLIKEVKSASSLGQIEEIFNQNSLAAKSLLQEAIDVEHRKEIKLHPQHELDRIKEKSLPVELIFNNKLPFKVDVELKVEKSYNASSVRHWKSKSFTWTLDRKKSTKVLELPLSLDDFPHNKAATPLKIKLKAVQPDIGVEFFKNEIKYIDQRQYY